MNLKNRKTILLIIVIIVIATCGLFVVLNNKTENVSDNQITGIVTDVVNIPNIAENGYYGFDIKVNSGQKYRINATGYMNNPAPPEQFGQACVDVPIVNIGDKVGFNLPKSESEENTFDICYNKKLTGYYFQLN